MFPSHRQKPEAHISHTWTVVSPRFFKLFIATNEKRLNNKNVVVLKHVK